MDQSAVWLITGCSTGFGHALASAVLARGQKAMVTARNPADLRNFAETYGPHVEIASLDIRNPSQIADVVRQAEARFGGIDVLVNNAGYGYLAAIEEGNDEEIRAMFDTNVFGLIAVTRAVLPGMRARRKGHVVNISSIGGLIGFPGVGYYNATKFAVEGFSEALAKEVKPLGIQVTIVEPGPFRTDWAGRSLRTATVAIADYADTAGARRDMIRDNSGRQPGDPVRAAKAIMTAVDSDEPPLHLLLGRPAFDAAKHKLQELSCEFDSWRNVSLDADFPINK
ncbi:oxidoreductase [Telmatospirillum sp.]|uniref:oxidoreductase n=1 Tax=Telmatospirillum sp. TaxID=2079197 RepID=UPI0028422CCD|nr:oxidoreductase [Telmatospirillum sp.]MDR3436067.1 oxidoreductase [Telmatospirillum sp.]